MNKELLKTLADVEQLKSDHAALVARTAKLEVALLVENYLAANAYRMRPDVLRELFKLLKEATK